MAWQAVLLIDMMQKWLFVNEVSVINVFYLYIFYYDSICIHEYAN